MNVYLTDEQDEPLDAGALRALAEHVLKSEGLPPETEMLLMLVDPVQMAGYNKSYMGRDEATDVLAFPVLDLEPGHPPRRLAGDPPVLLGDVLLCPAFIARRAEEDGVPPQEDLERLTVHGMLHLLGYDHDDPAAAEVMEEREDALLGLGMEEDA